jgi:hypothetical protein
MMMQQGDDWFNYHGERCIIVDRSVLFDPDMGRHKPILREYV